MSPQALAADQVWHTQDRATTLVSADDGIMHKSFMYDLGSEIIYRCVVTLQKTNN